MSIVFIEPAKGGFSIIRDGKESPWRISIESMVPVKKRTSVRDYYIIVRKGGKAIDRIKYDEQDVSWVVDSKDVPKYVKELCAYLLKTGDLNRYSQGRTYSNKFTELGMAAN
jgi:hypothetical protein